MNIAIYNGNKEVSMKIAECINAANSEYNKNWQYDIIANSKAIKINIKKYDVAILGIGKINGVSLAKALLNAHSHLIIIFVTSCSEYLDTAFEIGAFRFINEPDSQRLTKALFAAQEQIHKTSCYTYIKNSGAYSRVYYDDIIYVEIQNRKTLIVTKNGVMFSDYKISYWQGILKDYDFAVPHNSYIINLHYITLYKKRDCLVLNNSYIINISRTKATDFDNRYSLFIKDSKGMD